MKENINSKITDIITCENAYECQNVLATQLTGTDIKYYKEENIIKKVGGKQDVKEHLENLGFVVGGAVKVITS